MTAVAGHDCGGMTVVAWSNCSTVAERSPVHQIKHPHVYETVDRQVMQSAWVQLYSADSPEWPELVERSCEAVFGVRQVCCVVKSQKA